MMNAALENPAPDAVPRGARGAAVPPEKAPSGRAFNDPLVIIELDNYDLRYMALSGTMLKRCRAVTQTPGAQDGAAPPRPARGPAGPRAPELSEDAKACIQTLELSMGRPANPDITARDLDSMLADYVDENEDSVELVRSVRDKG